ncbi:unnamed protein product [Rangifer tarandus platyrhynchus]|uniref:Uncharacterized protein n=1 Tax=Rangifer tarandus platyrhynchus TaxID=3082113 RepID=A0AC59ZUD5_RANTA
MPLFESPAWTCLAVQWLRLHGSIAGGMGLIPDRGTEILNAVECGDPKNVLPKNVAFGRVTLSLRLGREDDVILILINEGFRCIHERSLLPYPDTSLALTQQVPRCSQ